MLKTMNKTQEITPLKILKMIQNPRFEELESEDVSSAEPVPTKKKSLFSSLIKRKKKVKKDTQNDEQKLVPYNNYHRDCLIKNLEQRLEKRLSEHEKNRNGGFLQKIMKKSRSNEEAPPEGIQSELALNNAQSSKSLVLINNVFTTAYTPTCDFKVVHDMNELQDILIDMHKCEDHMIQLLKKYIEDKSVQQEILQASFEFFALQYDTKSQTCTLSNNLWIQHLETSKTHEENMQKKLEFLVKQNRVLQMDIENLCRQCERFADRGHLYPKRFLKMKSFGKTYARHLVENNRKLLNKTKNLVEMIEKYEEELNRVQEECGSDKQEKINYKSQVLQIQSLLRKTTSDFELEKASLVAVINNDQLLIKDCEQASKFFYQVLTSFERQVREMSIAVNWPKFEHQEVSLAQLIYQIRFCAEELLSALIASHNTATTIVKDVNRLRDTNARLQENLQKSTSELDNLSKTLERTTKENETNTTELKSVLVKEVEELQVELGEQKKLYQLLHQELEMKNKELHEMACTVESISAERYSLRNQIEEVFKSFTPQNYTTDVFASQEKFEQMRSTFNHMMEERKQLEEKCLNLEEENMNLLQLQQGSQQELCAYHDGMNLLSTETELLKKQLATEHETVLSLQNERMRYLEEKNILKAIFNHLKAEVGRVQQLEATVFDMNKETNRLTLIAEFNKQMGEQFKNEVELKDHTISELRLTLEKLNNLQMVHDKQNMTLTAQLSEVSDVKEKLTGCLEVELKRNFELDETKKKLEDTTKSQLKIFEEMQRNERAALKELLKDFKSVVKQRDSLVKKQEISKKNEQELEEHYVDMRKNYDGVIALLREKEAEVKRMQIRIEEQDEELTKWQSQNVQHCKYEKSIKRLEKVIMHVRLEKQELESSNQFLKVNTQKLQADLNEARRKETEAATKSGTIETLEEELTKCQADVQTLNQENGKLKMEVEYLNKVYVSKSTELQTAITQQSKRDDLILESKSSVIDKDREIFELRKVIAGQLTELSELQPECAKLRKLSDDQNSVLIAYEDQLVMLNELENSKKLVDEQFGNLQIQHDLLQEELTETKKENQKLKEQVEAAINQNNNDTVVYRHQTEELLVEYSEHKETIEMEINTISHELAEVNESLQKEKIRFEQLYEIHEDLKNNFHKIKDTLTTEVTAHQQTCTKMVHMEEMMKNMDGEKQRLQQQLRIVMVQLEGERGTTFTLTEDKERLASILEKGRRQYATLQTKCIALEAEVKTVNDKLQNSLAKEGLGTETGNSTKLLEEKEDELEDAQNSANNLRRDLHESQKAMEDLKEDLFKLQQNVTALEFQNCELTLQLHETQGKLETENKLHIEVMEENESNIRTIMKLTKDRAVALSIGDGDDDDDLYD